VEHDQPLLRIAGFMSAVAASLLIISAAWLAELPHRNPVTPSPVSVLPIDSPEWQEVAVGVYVSPKAFQTDNSLDNLPAFAQADTQIVDLMLGGLSK
jgi:hypothetical protein